MINKIRSNAPFAGLVCGWLIGVLIFYILSHTDLNLPLYTPSALTFKDACLAILSQLKLFIIVALLGTSMLSGIIPPVLVLIKSTLASFSCALVYSSAVSTDSFDLQYFAFALTSSMMCVFLTSSARLAHIFYTKVPHESIPNVLDYIARQLFTMGFAIFAMTFYYTVLALT